MKTKALTTAGARSRPKQPTESGSESDSKTKSNVAWLPHSNIILSDQSQTARVNMKDQSTAIRAVLRRAMDLGEVYIVLGVPTDKKAGFLTADEAAAMHTPFSAIGMHFLALTALVHSAEEFGYAEEHGDIGHRLAEGSERRYIKPLRTHVSDNQSHQTISGFLSPYFRSFSASGLHEHGFSVKSPQHYHQS